MKILTTAQIREADAYTIRKEPIPSLELMERAASQIFHALIHRYPPYQSFHVFAGPGNNGGDGIALTRMLAEHHYPVGLSKLSSNRGPSADAQANLRRLPQLSWLKENWIHVEADLMPVSADTVIIDALFGSGLTRPLEGFAAAVVKHINKLENQVVSIDMPSGLFGEDNEANPMDSVVQADITLSLQFPKLCMLMPENQDYVGEIEVLPIGLHEDFIREVNTPYFYIEQDTLTTDWLDRKKFDHKGDFGHALLCAGSKGKIGAAVLAAQACMKSGVGLLTCQLPGIGYTIMQQAVPTAMVITDPDQDVLSRPAELNLYTALGLGPGMGTGAAAAGFLKAVLDQSQVPLVVDADALNILAEHPDWMRHLPMNTILTPHPGEFKRLFGIQSSHLKRLEELSRICMDFGIIIVLKGAHTVIGLPDGTCWFNSTGNPGMATAGSGDCLTGIILSLLARGLFPEDAARWGVYLHGRAGDLAVKESGQDGLLATDIINKLDRAFTLENLQV